MGSMVEDKKKYFGSLAFFGLLLTATFYFLLRDQELPQLFAAIGRVQPLALAAGLGLMFLFVSCEAFSSVGLLRSLGYGVGFFQCLKYAFIGFYFCSITPSASGGQPAQVYYMNKDRVSVGAASLDVLLVTLSYQVGILLLGGGLFLLRGQLILEKIGVLKAFLLFGVVANLCFISLFVLIVFHRTALRRAAGFCVGLLARLGAVRRPDDVMVRMDTAIDEYQRGAAHIKAHPLLLVRVFLATLVQLLCRLSIPFLVYRGFGLSGHSYLDVVALQAVLAISVESLPLPGAMGAAEAGFLAVNGLIFGHALLLPAMLVNRGISYYAFLVVSGAVALLAHWKTARKK